MFYEKSLGKSWFYLFEELVLIIKNYSHFSTFFTCLIKWKLLCNAGNLEQTLLSILVKCLKLSAYNLPFYRHLENISDLAWNHYNHCWIRLNETHTHTQRS